MQRIGDIKRALAERGLSPKKSLGQNFLIDASKIELLVEASGVGPGDCVLEVGPGTGVLTDVLVERGCRLVVCELDDSLAALIRDRFSGLSDERFALISGDCLSSKKSVNERILAALGGEPFRLVANLPYGAASALMIRLSLMPSCLGQYVTVQREVAQRARAEPGGKDYSALSVLLASRCAVRRLAVLPPGCFWPAPKVTSEMIAIEPLPEARCAEAAALERLCAVLFRSRRKQLGGLLKGRLPEVESWPAGVEPTMRPEALTVEQLCSLAKLID